MSNIANLEHLVRALYEAKDPDRTDWADWLYEHHVFIVADTANEFAKRFGANQELSCAAAMLHDIADAKMSRFVPEHEAESLKIANQLMQEAGYDSEEIKLVVDDAIKYHSCHNGQIPASPEGKVLATADAVAHLQSDFNVHAVWALANEKSLDDIKQYVLKKLDRDYHDKIQFDEVRAELEPAYLMQKQLFAL